MIPYPPVFDLIPDGVVRNGKWESKNIGGTAVPGHQKGLKSWKTSD